MCAAIARSVEEIPPDVDVIISQHHELPDGTGFPRGLNYQRITPLSTVFIVAHDLVRHLMLVDPQTGFSAKDVEEWFLRSQNKFQLGNFKKVMAAIPRSKM